MVYFQGWVVMKSFLHTGKDMYLLMFFHLFPIPTCKTAGNTSNIPLAAVNVRRMLLVFFLCFKPHPTHGTSVLIHNYHLLLREFY